MKPGTTGFSSIQRKWLTLSLNQQITLEPFNFSGDFYISSMTVLVDFLTKPRLRDANRDTYCFVHAIAGVIKLKLTIQTKWHQILLFSFEIWPFR